MFGVRVIGDIGDIWGWDHRGYRGCFGVRDQRRYRGCFGVGIRGDIGDIWGRKSEEI